jgi:NAD(P)-dependent dehydrogenase (short-subunit alcohol dehydrogenase family)
MSILDRFRLDGKVAVVTGASSGLGVDFARGLAEAGADVVIAARRVERLEETRATVEGLGRRCVAVAADVTSVEDCTRVVQTGMDELGRVDILANNAGLGTAYPATREKPEDFRRVIDVNLMGSYWMAQACGRVMQPGSSIVNIGSVLGSTTAGLPQAAYASSKAAIIGLTRDLAQQWTGRKGIRVNALAPGFFPSEMTGQYPEGYLDQMLWRVPSGRHGDPAELTAALVFLASDAASYITGFVLPGRRRACVTTLGGRAASAGRDRDRRRDGRGAQERRRGPDWPCRCPRGARGARPRGAAGRPTAPDRG